MQKIEKSRLRISTWCGGIFGVSWLIVGQYCYFHATRYPIEETGRIFAMNFHGTVLYLTGAEYYTFYGIPVFFLAIGLITALAIRFGRGRQ